MRQIRAIDARAPVFWRLVAAMVLVSTVTCGPIFYVSYVFNRESAERRVEQNLSQQVDILAQNFDQEYRVAPRRTLKQLSTSDSFLQTLSGPRVEIPLNVKALETQFFSIAKEHLNYSAISFLNPAGQRIAGINGRLRTGDIDGPSILNTAVSGDRPSLPFERELFQRIKTTPALLTAGNMEWFMPPREMVVEGPFTDEQGRSSLLAGLGALDPDSGAFAGVLVIQLNLDPFIDLLRTVKILDESPVWVFSRSGATLLKPETKGSILDPGGRLPEEESVEVVFLRTPQGVFAYRDLYFSGAEPLLRLVYALPVALLLKDMSSANRFYLLAMIASMILVLALAYAISRGISRPIVKLADASARLSRGDLSARVETSAGGELRVLIDSFNTMSANLQEANRNRAEAMDALLGTAALMRRQEPDAKQNPNELPAGPLTAPASPGNETEDIRRITGLIAQMIEEREQRLVELRAAMSSADEANRAKGNFLAAMSHEIRTPLNAVIGLAGELGNSDLSPQQLRLVSTMESAGNQLLEIVNDILDFSRLQSGRIDLNDQLVDLRALIERLMLIIRGLPNSAKLDIRARLDPSIPELVKTDGTRVMQILTNLLGNAVKFTAQGSVELAIAAESGEERATMLVFSVTDTGCGVPAELRSTLFQPFRQGSTGRLSPQPGTGLGLAISQRIAQAMGGVIEFDATLEIGARFVLRLPLQTAAKPDQQKVQLDQVPTVQRALRILVAEDTPANQLVIQLLLQRLGHRPTMVGDGKAAVSAFTKEAFDLVILDIQMPVMNGLDACREIRASERGERVPIVALTAFTQSSDRQNAFEAGMNAFVSKPVRAEEILRVIEEVMKLVRFD